MYEQSAAITSGFPLVHSAVESYCLGVQSDSAKKGLAAMEDLLEKYVKLGQEGFRDILNMRLDTILMMTDLQTLRQFDFELQDFKNLEFVQWASKFTEDLFDKHTFRI